MNIQRIDLAIKLLNEVETKGSRNLNNLLGAIQLLEGLKQEVAPGGDNEQRDYTNNNDVRYSERYNRAWYMAL